MIKDHIQKLSKDYLEIPSKPQLLSKDGDHSIYWLGSSDSNAFRTNIYLIADGEECLIIDPGSRQSFQTIKNHIEELGYLTMIKGLVVCHQDPDVAASMFDWLSFKPDIEIITTPRTNVLLPYYGINEYSYYPVDDTNDFRYTFSSGNHLEFIEAPFMHFPGAFATWDKVSKNIFTGDILAAIDFENTFIVKDFDEHKLKLDLFHIDYIASNIASRNFAKKLRNYQIGNIFPQHGAIIPKVFTQNAIEYLEELICGLDLIYVDEK